MVSDKEMIVNVGLGGARLAVEDESRVTDFQRLLATVSPDMILRMIQVGEAVSTKNQFFAQLESDGFNLMVLAAMGVTSVEAIEAFHTLKDRGYDVSKPREREVGVDEDYLNEITINSLKLPPLMDTNGVPLAEPKRVSDLFRESEEERYRLQALIDNSVAKNKESEFLRSESVVSTISSRMQELVDIQEGMNQIESIVEQEESVDTSDWEEAFKSLAEQINQLEPTFSHEKQVKTREEADVKTIFILSSNLAELPVLEGYRLRLIQDPIDLTLFTSSRDNLLVLDGSVPRQLLKVFSKWFKRLASKGQKYRIVSLAGSSIRNSVIEATVLLTKESIDGYYERYPLERYQGTGLGSFFDIEKELERESG